MKDYFDYFERLAKECKEIGHSESKFRFAMMSIEEALDASNNILDVSDSFAMLLESPEGGFDGKHSGKMHLEYLGAFWVFSHAPLGNYAKQREVTEQAFEIGRKIITRIQYDFENNWDVPGIPSFIRNFNFAQVQFQKIGPVFDNCHGYRFTYDIKNPTDLVFDENDWELEDE